MRKMKKKSATFPKYDKSPHNNGRNINDDKNTNKTNISQKYEIKNVNISMSDITFISEKQEKKEENYSKLLLTGDLFYEKEIIITDSGMLNGKRNKKDGFSVFGLKNTKDRSGQLINDFLLILTKVWKKLEKMKQNQEKFSKLFLIRKIKHILYILSIHFCIYIIKLIIMYIFTHKKIIFFLLVKKKI